MERGRGSAGSLSRRMFGGGVGVAGLKGVMISTRNCMI